MNLFDNPEIRTALAAFCARWDVARLEAFGSVVRDDFGPESDIDLLATATSGELIWVMDRIHMIEELKVLLGRDVDLIDRVALAESWNWILRRNIFAEAQVVYDAAEATV